MARLKVKWFDLKRGYGFLSSEEGGDVFVHYKGMVGSGRKDLYEGQTVECEVVPSDKGPRAVNVRVVDNNRT